MQLFKITAQSSAMLFLLFFNGSLCKIIASKWVTTRTKEGASKNTSTFQNLHVTYKTGFNPGIGLESRNVAGKVGGNDASLTRKTTHPKYQIVQFPVKGLGLASYTQQISRLNYFDCIHVQHPNVPTTLKFHGNTQYQSSYKIIGYHKQDCDVSGSTTSLNFGDQINKRTRICSFQLNHSHKLNSGTKVTITFVGESSSSPSFSVTLPAINTSCQSGLCFFPQVAYANSVNITTNKNNARNSNSIRLFKDETCGEEIGQDVSHRKDLARLTRETMEIKSFRVVRL